MIKNPRIWDQISSHFGAQIGPKSIQKSIRKLIQNLRASCHRFLIDFGRFWGPSWGPRAGHFLVFWLLFSVPGGLGSQNGFQGFSQQPLGSAQGSISIDFGSILDDFLMIFCIMWALPSTVSRHGAGKAEGEWICSLDFH